MKARGIDIYSVQLAINQAPTLSVDRGRDIVRYGPKNDFPSYLLFLFKNHPMHGGIVKGKARYLSGKSIKTKDQSFNAENFLKKANAKETWYDLSKKLDLDECISGGFFLKITTNAIGQPLQYVHMSFAKCRISPCQKFVHFSEDWSKLYEYPVTIFPIWSKGVVGTSIYVYKSYSPCKTLIEGTYSEPEYISCTLDIDTDIRIGSFSNSLVRNNFSAGNVITVRNGEADKTKQKAIAETLQFNYEGEENAGKSVVIFANKEAGATDIQSINTTDQDKQYVEVNKRDQQNILTSHNVNGILFKIKTEGQLGGTSELVEAHELFLNEYVKVKQEQKLEMMQMFFTLRYNEVVNFEIEQVSPIGLDLPLDNQTVVDTLNAKDPNIITKYLIDKYNIQIPEVVDENGKIVNQPQVNENLKGISGRENQDMLRVAKQYNSGKITLVQAILRLVSGFGMTEEEAKKWIGANDNLPGDMPVQQSSQDKSIKFFELFDKYAHEINFEDEIIDNQEVKFSSLLDAVKFEKVRFKDYVNDPLNISVKDLTNEVLNQVKGNPDITTQEISRILKVDVDKVDSSLEALKKAGLITGGSGKFTPTDKGINKVTDDTSVEVYTEYVYAKRADVSGATVIPTTREFCKNLVNQTKSKALTFEAINQLENEFGENVWDFRGGFYTKKGTNETTPWCRHAWSAVTKIRRTKK